MAFDLRGFQFGRGVTTAYANGDFVAANHTYKSDDTLATISTPGYFPPNIDGSTDKVVVGDVLTIVGSDGIAMVTMTGLSPITLSPDAFVNATLTVGAPITAVDNNGITLSGSVLAMEKADETHGGIVTNSAQTFGGVKTFADILRVGEIRAEAPATAIVIGASNTTSTTIGDLGSPCIAPVLISDNLQRTASLADIEIGRNHPGKVKIGLTASNSGIQTNFIDSLDTTTQDLKIGDAHTVGMNPVIIGATGGPNVQFPAGIYFNIGAGSINGMDDELVTSFTFTGPFTVPQSGYIEFQRFNNVTYMTIRVLPNSAASVNAIITSGAIIPVNFRPAASTYGLCAVVNNGVQKTGSFTVSDTGVIGIYAADDIATPFTASGTAGFGIITASWPSASF